MSVRQVVQHLRTGSIEVLDLPAARPGAREVLIRTRRSLLSAGTERMLVEFGRAGLIGKARQQPERVRQLLDRLRTDGVGPVLEAVFNKLDEPLALGYANVGTIVAAGQETPAFREGDRVVSNAPHATWAKVPASLCAKIPAGVSDDEAAFVVPAAIGLQGMRLAAPTLGETFAVIGTGLIGLLTVQLLSAAGCRVIAIDTRQDRLELARKLGAECVLAGAELDVPAAVVQMTHGRGVDAVLIAAATDSDAPVRDGARMTRKRGRLVLIGVAGLQLSRADFYAKELSLQVSCSYGPGRYDPEYELKGHDYPLAYVRWTEQRNFEAVLDLMHARRLNVGDLISHRFSFERAAEAYEALLADPGALGILLTYSDSPAASVPAPPRTIKVAGASSPAFASGGGPRISVIGAGNYARRFLLPALRASDARLDTLVSSGSAVTAWTARRAGFVRVSTDATRTISDPEADAVVIATRHDSHARYTCEALAAGKHVFVEKPLALNEAELAAVEEAYARAGAAGRAPVLAVGFNRRFAPHVIELKRRLARLGGPRCFIFTVNAGAIAADHWIHDPLTGGGRIVGEACHFIDTLRFLAGCPIVAVSAASLPGAAHARLSESSAITLRFADDSIGTVHYLANGARRFPKERIEVFAGGDTLQLNNFRSLESYASPGLNLRLPRRQDKGNSACVRAFVAAVRGEGEVTPFSEIVEVSRATLEAARQAQARDAASMPGAFTPG